MTVVAETTFHVARQMLKMMGDLLAAMQPHILLARQTDGPCYTFRIRLICCDLFLVLCSQRSIHSDCYASRAFQGLSKRETSFNPCSPV
jgi:hypothetical protein